MSPHLGTLLRRNSWKKERPDRGASEREEVMVTHAAAAAGLAAVPSEDDLMRGVVDQSV